MRGMLQRKAKLRDDHVHHKCRRVFPGTLKEDRCGCVRQSIYFIYGTETHNVAKGWTVQIIHSRSKN